MTEQEQAYWAARIVEQRKLPDGPLCPCVRCRAARLRWKQGQ